MNEKMAILKMLEEGKITADEASKLLDSVNNGTSSNSKRDYDNNEYVNPSKHNNSRDKYDVSDSSISNDQSSGSSSRDFIKDLGKKINNLASDLEPKIQKFTGVVTEKTSDFADKVSRSFSGSKTSSYEKKMDTGARSYQNQSKSSKESTKTYGGSSFFRPSLNEKQFELYVSSKEPNELIIPCLNGSVYLKGYNGDKISAKVLYTPKTQGAKLDFVKLGYIYQLKYNSEDFKDVQIEAYIPISHFKIIKIETNNAPVTIENLNSENIRINVENSDINLKNISFDHIKCENINGNIVFNDLTGSFLSIDNANGYIDAINIDVSKIKMETSSNYVLVTNYSFKKYDNYEWQIRTSNAKLNINAPISEHIGYDISAHTSLSNVVVNISGLNYSQKERNYVDAKTSNYSRATKKVRFELDTSNAPLLING